MDAGLAFYSMLVSVAKLWFRGTGARVWVRNGVRFGLVQPFVSDIDLTVDCRGSDSASVALRRYRWLKRILPAFGEANWVCSGSEKFLKCYANLLELRRDPELQELLGRKADSVISLEDRVTFLLRLLVADRRNLLQRPGSRRKKWGLHLREAGLADPREPFTVESLVSAISPLFEAQGALKREHLLALLSAPGGPESTDIHSVSDALIHVRDWFVRTGKPEGFAWAVRTVQRMNASERALMRSQLLWELAYACLAEPAPESRDRVGQHVERVISLLRAVATDWSSIFDEFAGARILSDHRLSGLRNLKEWNSLPACIAPWRGICVGSDGRLSLCELSRPLDLGTARGRNLETVFVSESLTSIRSQMERGELPDLCQECVQEESLGARSRRMILNDETGVHGGRLEKVPVLRSLHLSFGNKCSQVCITCSSRLSSSWARLAGVSSESSSEWSIGAIRETIRESLHSLNEVIIAGGDPFEDPSHGSFLADCVEGGRAQRITLSYRLCAAGDPAPFFEKWRHFKSVNVKLWIDGHYESAPYVRYPVGWEDFSARIRAYDACPDNVEVHLGCQIHALSIAYLPELCRWISAQKFRRIKTGKAGRHLLVEPIGDESFFSPRNCPDALKKAITRKYDQEPFMKAFLSDEDLELILHRMNSERGNPALLLRICGMIDKMRGTSFQRALPELARYFQDGR